MTSSWSMAEDSNCYWGKDEDSRPRQERVISPQVRAAPSQSEGAVCQRVREPKLQKYTGWMTGHSWERQVGMTADHVRSAILSRSRRDGEHVG